MITPQQALKILEFRNKQNPYESEKEEFYNYLFVQFCDYGNPVITKGRYGCKHVDYNPKLKSFEMWSIGEEQPLKNYKGISNTRTKVNSETCFEIDKLDREQAHKIICEIILSLIRNKYHFFVWYAEGQRSPHIRIYDFEELQELDPKQRYKAQLQFWRKIAPFSIQYADMTNWIDEHPYQMEYALHWKYGTPFNLLFEYTPSGINSINISKPDFYYPSSEDEEALLIDNFDIQKLEFLNKYLEEEKNKKCKI